MTPRDFPLPEFVLIEVDLFTGSELLAEMSNAFIMASSGIGRCRDARAQIRPQRQASLFPGNFRRGQRTGTVA